MKSRIFLGVIIIAIVVVFSSMFQVNEMEQAILIRLGKPVGKPIETSGLKFKMPIIDQVVKFDKRILEYDSEPKEIITKDKKNLVVDSYAKWKIKDPLKFLQTVNSYVGAQTRIDDIVYSELRQVIGKYTLIEIISTERENIMEIITKDSSVKLAEFGIELIDARMKRAELPKQNEENIYRRMEAERNEQAKKYRAEGQEISLQVKSNADKEKTIILAEAYKTSQNIKGEGDSKALQIYAEAYNKDKEFYRFVRTLEAYEKIFGEKNNNRMILSTETELFRVLSETK
ncbi:protease FtsH subunit HflC [Hypnocyclicus thermotrophus]|uniref:Protein HflC n=1 Tax=Hypnocyclicus thermotrophus TaxID=1627895 RepID=A0AA46I5F4_9FUSO|nr:protease modulator HflC [Hypnocyclicus thermotrophus]TDT70431.1 protease FtsH subunit HflC [Hypnocyclicus thermotrophus]